MATQTKELTPQQKALISLQDLLFKHKDQIAMALPKHMNADRMLRVALTAATTTPALLNCDSRTVAGCIVQAAILGLEPSTVLGEAYLIPYGKTCQLIPGYKGLLKLVRNSGELVMINAQEVRANDDFEFEDGLDPFLRHKRGMGGPEQRGPVVSYWAGAVLKGGGKQFVVMTKQEVEAHGKKYSKSFTSGPWKTEFDEMAKKTCLRKLCKYLPASVEARIAIALDEQHEVGIPQQFSLDVPLELQPVQNDPNSEDSGPIGMPQRASESQQQQPGALEQPPETDTSRLNLEGFPEPFSINAFKVACAKVYQRMVDSPMGQAAAQAEWQRAMKANNVKDPNGVASKEAAEKLFSMLVGIAQISESMRTSGED